MARPVIANLITKIASILQEEAKRSNMIVKTEVISTSPAAVVPGNCESRLVKIAEADYRRLDSSSTCIEGNGISACHGLRAKTENERGHFKR